MRKNLLLLSLLGVIMLFLSSCYVSTKTYSPEKVAGSDKIASDNVRQYSFSQSSSPSLSNPTFKVRTKFRDKYEYRTKVKKKHKYKTLDFSELIIGYGPPLAYAGWVYYLWEPGMTIDEFMDEHLVATILGGAAVGWLIGIVGTTDGVRYYYKEEYTTGSNQTYTGDYKYASNQLFTVKANGKSKDVYTDNSGYLAINPLDFKYDNLSTKSNVSFSVYKNGTYLQKFSQNTGDWTKPYVTIVSSYTPVYSSYSSSKRVKTAVKNMEFERYDYQNGRYKIMIDNNYGWIDAKDARLYYSSKSKASETKNLDFEPVIKEYVIAKMEEWIVRGEFEKKEDYAMRISPDNRAKVRNFFTQEALNQFGSEQVVLKNPVLHKYDPDNEVFKITFDDGIEFLLGVPIVIAPDFKSNFNRAKFVNLEYNLLNKKFILTRADVDLLDTVFTYDRRLSVNYKKTDDYVIDIDKDINIPNYVVTPPSGNTPNAKKSDVDINIPETKAKKENTYALIIGNEHYAKYQTGLTQTSDVEFAVNDAKMFKEYLVKTVGIPAENIIEIYDAQRYQMVKGINQLVGLAEVGNSETELIFYYAGHGFPEKNTKESYLIPVDIPGAEVTNGIKISDLYTDLTKHNPARVTVFLDACFSGGGRNQGLVPARSGIVLQPKEEKLKGNLIVFSATSGDQIALPYSNKKHGMFTYFLLKALKNSNGNITYGKLADELIKNVPKTSILENSKKQIPEVNVSPSIGNKWENWKVK